MGKKVVGIIKIILCILIITFAESYFFEALAFIGIKTNSLSFFMKELLILILYILIFICIYIVYKDDVKADFNRFRRNILPNILMSLVFFIILTILLAVTGYICNILAKSFHLNYVGLSHLNIFNDTLDIYLIFYIIKNIIIIPFIKCAVYVLGVNELCDKKSTGIILSGLVGAVVAAFSFKGSLLYIIFNIIPYLVLYLFLSSIYRKNNNNIWYSIITFIAYTLLASVLLAQIT